MTTNPYFLSNYYAIAEQSLADSLVIESHQTYGIDLKYIPRTLINYDKLYGEDTKSAFNDAYTLEFYLKSYEGYAGGSFLNKFGLTITEELVFTVARGRFTEVVTSQNNDIKVPREGDLIYVPQALDERKRIYEISFVNPLEVFSQFGDRYTWEIRCRVFDFNGESFNTGDAEIDILEKNYLSTEIELANGTDFAMTDLVSQSNGWEAMVLSCADNLLLVTNTKGVFDETLPITNGIITRDAIQVNSYVVNDSNDPDNDIITEIDEAGLIVHEPNPFLD